MKLTAADAVQRLLTRAPGQTPADVLAGMQDLLAPDLDEVGVLAALDSLSEGVETTGEVVYPQYSGLAPNSQQARLGAAMVVVRRTALDRQGRTSAHTRTVDVRLSVVDGAWRVTGVPSVGGQPVARPAEVSPAAARVLDNPLVDLPDTARWDVHAGLVADDLLDLVAMAADLGPVSVTVMATGHPREVFNTVTVSAHTAGRAVDLWRIDRLDVVDDRGPTGPLARLQAAALASERTSQVGGPPGTDVDGPGSRRSFMDRVHDDHLHLAVLPEGAPPYLAPTAPAG